MEPKKPLAVFIAALLLPACFAGAQTVPPEVYDDSENIVVVALHKGDTIVPRLTEAVRNHGITSGLILGAIGQLRDFTLGFYEITYRKYYKKTYPGPYEFGVTQGIIGQAKDGSISMDIVAKCDSTNTDLHASDVIFWSVGGHLYGGIVATNMVAIVIKRLDTIKLVREYHPENGTWDLGIYFPSPGVNGPQSAGVIWRQEYKKAVNGRTALFGADPNATVFDVAGRRIKRLRNGRLENVAPGMYLTPQRVGKTGTIIKP